MLLVDDDASMRRALVRTIGLAGFEVEAFASAETLLARGIRSDDACLVLDIDLPGMNGIQCKRTLDAAGRRVPTVFITALTSAEVRESLARLGPSAVLYKPFSKNDLLDAIGQACR